MRIAVCDDDGEDLAIYSKKIKTFAEQIGEPVSIAGYSNAKQVLFALSDAKEAADILFLDIHLPDSDGITLAKKLRDLGYCNEIVFLTVASDKMLSAFDVGAYNYIIKDNTTDERFKYVVTSAIETARQQRDAYMLFSAGGENINVPVRDIMYFEVVNRIIVVHYGDQTFEFFSTIGKLENRLRSYGFVRIHRSILVAKAYIRDFTYREVTLINGEQLPVSRGKYALLKEAMADE